MARARLLRNRIQTEALLLRSVPYGESDLVVTLFTQAVGRVSAVVHGGRKGTKRLGGALEPLHTMVAALEERSGRELLLFKEGALGKLRLGIERSLDALDAAGVALRWLRHLCPPRVPEPEAWETITNLLDALDAGNPPRPALALAGIHLLADVGWAIELEKCVRCGKTCPDDRPAMFDPGAGGIMCRECGGGRLILSASARTRALLVLGGDEIVLLSEAEVTALLGLVDAALSAHAEFEADHQK